MGILNITPDSFYDGGKYKDEKSILQKTEQHLKEGARFIDLGAYSSRPNAAYVSEDEELRRITTVIELILGKFPEIHLSIDTFRSRIAEYCIEAGAAMINDISGGDLDPDMMNTISRYQVPYVMMHMKGSPQTMSEQTDYENLLKDIKFSFSDKIARARRLKINDIILDPGFGFAKTRVQNFELLRSLDYFQTIGLPLLVGVSRKSMIYKTLETTAENALNGTTALHMYALGKGANILRVHDVKEAMECIKLYEEIEHS